MTTAGDTQHRCLPVIVCTAHVNAQLQQPYMAVLAALSALYNSAPSAHPATVYASSDESRLC